MHVFTTRQSKREGRRRYCEGGADNLNGKKATGGLLASATPLHAACMVGNVRTAAVLLAAGADPDARTLPDTAASKRKMQGLTPLVRGNGVSGFRDFRVSRFQGFRV